MQCKNMFWRLSCVGGYRPTSFVFDNSVHINASHARIFPGLKVSSQSINDVIFFIQLELVGGGAGPCRAEGEEYCRYRSHLGPPSELGPGAISRVPPIPSAQPWEERGRIYWIGLILGINA